MEPDEEDAEALALLREVAALLEAAPPPALGGSSRGRAALDALQELAPMLPELAPGLGYTGAATTPGLPDVSAIVGSAGP